MSVKVTIEWEDGVTETYQARGIWIKEEREETSEQVGPRTTTRTETRAEIAFKVESRTVTGAPE